MDIHTAFSQLKKENSQLKNDIRKIQMQLEYEKQKNLSQYENIPIPYITINFNGDILKFNKTACVFFGRKPEALCFDNLMEFLDIDSKGRMTLFCQMMSEGRLRKQIEKSELEINFFVRGKRYETMIHYSLIFQEGEWLLELAIWDVTETNEAKRQLKKEHECYQIALKTSSDYIFEYNIADDKLLEYGDFMKPEIPKTKEVTKENFLGRIKEAQKEMTGSYLRLQELLNGKRMSAEIDFSEIDYYHQKRWVHLELSPTSHIFNEARMIGRIRDITEKKVKQQKEKERKHLDEITGFYHSQYGIKMLINRLEEIHQRGEQSFLYFLALDVDKEAQKNYGFTFVRGMVDIAGKLIKKKVGDDKHITVIRCGNKEFLFLIEKKEETEALNFSSSLLKEMQEQYCGNIQNGKVFYRGIFIKNLQWEGYPKWGEVLQWLYDMQSHEHKEGLILLDKKIPPQFCSKQKVTLGQYQGTSEIYDTKAKPLFSYAYDLIERAKDIESIIPLLMNMVGVYKRLKFVSIYELNQTYLSKSLLYHWNERGKEIEGQKICYCPSKEEWNSLFSWEEQESRCRCQTAKQIKEDQGKGWIAPYKEETSQILCISKEDRGSQLLIVFGFEKEKEDWEKEEQEFYFDFAKILFIGINQSKASSLSMTKSMFLARMSHEIRTPISGIVGTMQLLESTLRKQEIHKNPEVVSVLRQMGASVKSLLRVTDSVLDMAQIEDYTMKLISESFRMKELLERLQTQFGSRARKKNIHFHYEEGTLIEELHGDEKRFYQVLYNLLDNAMKYTEENGNVFFSISAKRESETSAVYQVEIGDDGCGIAKEDQERIFQAFTEVSKGGQSEGIGLGLCISLAIVNLMGGTLELESEKGMGTKIQLLVPFKVVEEVRIQEDISSITGLNGMRILLAEDNELNAMIVQELLEIEGAKVDIAKDGIEAVSFFEEKDSYYYQLILMDLRMPNMDGFEATRTIRSLEREDARTIPIVALSAELLEQSAKKTVEIGLDGYLTKPLSVELLKELISKNKRVRKTVVE